MNDKVKLNHPCTVKAT